MFFPPARPRPPSVRRQTSGLAVASRVCGVLALFTLGISALPAIILGHLSLSRINKSAGVIGGRGMARGGLIIGYLFIFLVAAALSGSVMMSSFARKIAQEREVQTVQAAEKLVQSMREYAKNNNGMLPPHAGNAFRGGSNAGQQAGARPLFDLCGPGLEVSWCRAHHRRRWQNRRAHHSQADEPGKAAPGPTGWHGGNSGEGRGND